MGETIAGREPGSRHRLKAVFNGNLTARLSRWTRSAGAKQDSGHFRTSLTALHQGGCWDGNGGH
ncbi:hypothetical protein AU509_12430 [Lonsdalea britannica]|uniref:Uncharacterized protein n=1 Tax=Lonsdalea britannica TaxID=1082704 RepID=A0AAD0WLJ9_9GAMM|nr:hypothetical protein CKQ53_13450 [Lonsdalea britannica]OSM95994.1 hypothetical protein AU509_12430 [Lonsdalea britannica]OSN06882.1 hypothetical protein AU510_06640 [Lonsdalea britannica]